MILRRYIFTTCLIFSSKEGYCLKPSVSDWQYQVSYFSDQGKLKVTLSFPATEDTLFTVDDTYLKFVKNVQEECSASKTKLLLKDGWWNVKACSSPNVKLTYEYMLADAARLSARDLIHKSSDVFVTWPEAWLLHPSNAQVATASISFLTKGKDKVATGLLDKLDPSTFRIKAGRLDELPITAFGPLVVQTVRNRDAEVEIALVPSRYSVSEKEIMDWALRGIAAVEKYYDGLPAKHSLLLILPRGERSRGGVTYGNGGAVNVIPLSLDSDAKRLKNDWVLTHELVHQFFPNVDRKSQWIEEGLATYIESISRLRSKDLTPEVVFRDLAVGMPKGLPASGDRGLDITHTWGRTYWGGAIFCLQADIEIRKQSKGKFGLEHALRAISRSGLSVADDANLLEVLRIGDNATKLKVLETLYNEVKDKPFDPKLNLIWRDLGVVYDERTKQVSFDDKAPSAYVRRGIVNGGEVSP